MQGIGVSETATGSGTAITELLRLARVKRVWTRSKGNNRPMPAVRLSPPNVSFPAHSGLPRKTR